MVHQICTCIFKWCAVVLAPEIRGVRVVVGIGGDPAIGEEMSERDEEVGQTLVTRWRVVADDAEQLVLVNQWSTAVALTNRAEHISLLVLDCAVRAHHVIVVGLYVVDAWLRLALKPPRVARQRATIDKLQIASAQQLVAHALARVGRARAQ